MQHYEVGRDNFLISDDKLKFDCNIVYNYLCNESCWAKNILLHVLQTSIQHSICFGLYNIDE